MAHNVLPRPKVFGEPVALELRHDFTIETAQQLLNIVKMWPQNMCINEGSLNVALSYIFKLQGAPWSDINLFWQKKSCGLGWAICTKFGSSPSVNSAEVLNPCTQCHSFPPNTIAVIHIGVKTLPWPIFSITLDTNIA